MVGRLIFGLLAIMFGVLASPIAAQDELPGDVASRDGAVKLEPISPWNIDFGENRCRLSRMFGSTEDEHLVFFEQGAPSRTFAVTLGGPNLRPWSRGGRLNLGLESDEPMERLEQVAGADLGKFGPAVIIQSATIDDELEIDDDLRPDQNSDEARQPRKLYEIDLSEAAKVERLVLNRGKRVLVFETGNMKGAFAALNQCARSFVTDWGLDLSKHDYFTPAQWKNQRGVAKKIQLEYPTSALRKGEQGIFRMRAIIEADGSVSECHISSATLTGSLSSPACEAVKRSARFEPALDANGKPMRSFFTTRIIYSFN